MARYARSLAEGGLARTALGTEWLAAAARALQHPVALAVLFTEVALLDPASPMALGYAVTLKRGQRLDVQVTLATDIPSQVFVDLFEPGGQEQPASRAVASAVADGRALSHESIESGVYVLRVQPELLRGGHVRITGAAPHLCSFRYRAALFIRRPSVAADDCVHFDAGLDGLQSDGDQR